MAFSIMLARSLRMRAMTVPHAAWVAGVRRLAAASGARQRFPVPAMGDSITEGTIVEIGKAVGDRVDAEELLMQVETDKVTIDVRSPESGVLTSLFSQVGDTIIVGNDLYELELGEGSAASASATADAAAPPPPQPAAEPPAAEHAGGSAPAASGQRVHPSGNPVLISFSRRGTGGATSETTASEARAPKTALATSPSSSVGTPASAHPFTLAPLWSAQDEEVVRRYRRLQLSEDEMAVIDSGGADHFIK